jgi:hypothetical protein
MNLVFQNLVKTNTLQFCEKVRCISAKLQIVADWLMCVMFIESALNPKAQNPRSKAVGLVQWMPKIARALGTTTEQLMHMSNVEQLDFVYELLKPFAGKMHTVFDVYFAIFFPRAIGKPGDYVLKTSTLSAAVIASQNDGYDIDKNGEILKREVEQVLMNRLPVLAQFRANVDTEPNTYIVSLQRFLIAQGFDLGRSGADGIFGNYTAKAVQSYFGRNFVTLDELNELTSE